MIGRSLPPLDKRLDEMESSHAPGGLIQVCKEISVQAGVSLQDGCSGTDRWIRTP